MSLSAKLFIMSFRQKINLVLGSLVATLLLIAALFYVSAERYQHHLERNGLAHSVLDNYLAISDQSYRKLSALAQAVETGAVVNENARANNLSLLKAALKNLAESLRAESDFLERWPVSGRSRNESQRAAIFADIEVAINQLLSRSRYILSLLNDGDISAARAALQELRLLLQRSGFDDRVALAIRDERDLVSRTDAEAQRLRRWVTVALPLVVLAVAVFVLGFATVLSRHLNRSITALRTAADALAEGDLKHRVGELPEAEFRQLSVAFNHMAAELNERREEDEHAKAHLEQQVATRTRELSDSNAELQRESQSRRKLLANIGHELRTPLTIISGEAQLALKQLNKADAVPSQFQQPLQQVLEQTRHTSRLVDDLLFIARAEASEPGLRLSDVDLVLVAEECVQAFTSLAGSRSFRCTLVDALPLTADVGRIRQVVNILLDNALCYSPEGDVISVSGYRDNQAVRFMVENGGAIISAGEAERVFERFYRGAKSAAEGSGLGLSVAKSIIESHGGELSFSPRIGGGAKVVFWLPESEVGE